MSYPKFYVTYCVMDTEAGANPFNHSFLIFSKQELEHGPVEALDSIGYYSQPNTTTNPIIKNIKALLGFQIDLQDGHGVLRQEQMHTINVSGIKGVSFLLNEHQFKSLQTYYAAAMQAEQEAIKELNNELACDNKPANGYTRYIREQEKAKAENRTSRLTPFHVTMNITSQGFDSSASYTCKDRALCILKDNGIIDETVKQQIAVSKAKHAFPRFYSLALHPIRLISVGEREQHVSKSGRIFYNHTWGKNKLFWATPLATIDALNTCAANTNYPLIKTVLNRIAAMEQLLYKTINQLKDPLQHAYLNQLKIQLVAIQQLSVLFTNSNTNQNHTVLAEHLAVAEQTLKTAHLTIQSERSNSTFLLNAYNSIAARNAVTGLLTLMLSAALISASLAAGIALCAVSTISVGRQLYGFYKQEKNSVLINTDEQPNRQMTCPA